MAITCSKLASLVIAAIYLVAAIVSDWNARSVLSIVVWLGLALALIWFPEELGRANRPYRTGVAVGRYDQDSPPAIVAGFGWIFLVGPVIVGLLNFIASIRK